MPTSFLMVVLGTQLVMTIADGVPKFDIARGCRLDNTRAFDLSTGQNKSVKICVSDERQTQWFQFRASNGIQCTAEANMGSTPSYVDLLTCLQAAKVARQLPK